MLRGRGQFQERRVVDGGLEISESCLWPESAQYINEQFKHLPVDMVQKMTCENAGRFYGLL